MQNWKKSKQTNLKGIQQILLQEVQEEVIQLIKLVQIQAPMQLKVEMVLNKIIQIRLIILNNI